MKSKIIKVTEHDLEGLSKVTEVLEVLDKGVKILISRNGIVMREVIAKWDDVLVVYENGIIDLFDSTYSKALYKQANAPQENVDNTIVMAGSPQSEFVVHTYDETLKDFVVVCDETNNTQENIDNNEVITDVVLNPKKAKKTKKAAK